MKLKKTKNIRIISKTHFFEIGAVQTCVDSPKLGFKLREQRDGHALINGQDRPLFRTFPKKFDKSEHLLKGFLKNSK